MSIKETLERFDKQFEYAQSMSNARGCFIIFCRKDNLPASTGQIKQFIVEEIKLSMEEMLKSKTFPELESDDFDKGYAKAVEDFSSNISKYFEV